MPGQNFSIIPQGGMVYNGENTKNSPNTFRKLFNMRLARGGGFLEQTPNFLSYGIGTWSAGSYYNRDTAASATSPSTEKASILLNFAGFPYSFSRYSLRNFDGVRQRTHRQTTIPSGTGTTKRCLAIIENGTSLGLNLGDTLDVVIDAATTFKWRKNGGAYTTGVAIASSVSIDSGNVTLYFLATSGFTVSDTWSWMRTDDLQESNLTSGYPQQRVQNWSYCVFGSKMYFVDYSGRVMVYEINGSQCYSLGYRPVFGTHVTIFQGHLFVANFSEDNASASILSGVLACSDLNNIHNFYPTDVNEADTFSNLSGFSTLNSSVGYTLPPQCGLFVKNDFLYVLTSYGIWFTSYAGLPIPFSFRQFKTCAINYAFSPVETDNGIYFLGDDGIIFFDGSEFTNVLLPIFPLFYRRDSATDSNNRFPIVWGFYHAQRREVHFYMDFEGINLLTYFPTNGFLVYQEESKSWYYRAASFDNGIGGAAMVSLNRIFLAGKLQTLQESWGSSGTHMKDYLQGVNWQEPTIETQDLDFGHTRLVKEVEPMYLEAYYDSTSNATFQIDGIRVAHSTRKYIGAAVSYTNPPIDWTTALRDGVVSNRVSGRVFRFKITCTLNGGGTNKAGTGFYFHGLYMDIHGLPEQKK